MFKEIDFLGNKIPLFGLCAALGAGVAMIVWVILVKKSKFEKQRFDKFCTLLPILILGGILGAMIFDKIAHFGESPWYKPAGISFAGGLLMGLILYVIFYRLIVSKDKTHFINDLSLLVAPFIIAHAFGRIGCFLGGCCYGKPSKSFLAVTFPEGSLQHQQYGYITPVLPTQLFEAFFLFVLFFIMVFFIKKYKVGIYLISYGVFRFILEFFRGDNRGKFGLTLSPSQLMSIVFILIGVFFLVYEFKILHKEKESKVLNV